MQAADTLSSITASLAILVSAVQPASAAGPVITIPDSHSIRGRVGGVATTLREVGRERVTVQIVVWAPSDAARNAVGSALEPGLRSLRRLPLVDLSIAMIRFGQIADNDETAKSAVYRRTLALDVEYASTVASTAAEILSFGEAVTVVAGIGGAHGA
ncbi:MAG: hypothetical protein WDN69_10110 [Aliidongia sp.]